MDAKNQVSFKGVIAYVSHSFRSTKNTFDDQFNSPLRKLGATIQECVRGEIDISPPTAMTKTDKDTFDWVLVKKLNESDIPAKVDSFHVNYGTWDSSVEEIGEAGIKEMLTNALKQQS